MMKQLNIRVIDEFVDAIERGVYDRTDERQRVVFLYIFVPLVQRLLNDYLARYNSFRKRRNPRSILPTGCSPDYAFNCPETFGGVQCGINVDVGLIDQIMAREYPNPTVMNETIDHRMSVALDRLMLEANLRHEEITLNNAWAAFSTLLQKVLNIR
jgi:hypothetical protein